MTKPRRRKESQTNSCSKQTAGGPILEDRSFVAYLRPTPRPFLYFASGHFPAATVTQPHSHPCIALHGCLHGPVTFCTPEGEFPMEAGVFYLVGPGCRHSWRNEGRHTAATLSMLLETSNPGRWPAGIGMERCCRELERHVRGFIRFTTAGDQELNHSFWAAADYLTAEQPQETVSLTGVLLTMLGQIKERLVGDSRPPCVEVSAAQKIRRLLLARLRDRLTIREIAREVAMSPSRAKQAFCDTFGCGIIAYFNQLKIWQAKRLLNDPSLTVEQVSHQLGFSSPSYFSRAFLNHTGVSPTAYRHAMEATQKATPGRDQPSRQ